MTYDYNLNINLSFILINRILHFTNKLFKIFRKTQENHRQQIKSSLLAEHMKNVDLENDTFAERTQIEGKA